MKKSTSLKRALHPMQPMIKGALVKNGLMDAYNARPPYQRNDYIGWIWRAKLDSTREKRLTQMLKELRQGTHYMNMLWKAGHSR
jgi:hypothetical protein